MVCGVEWGVKCGNEPLAPPPLPRSLARPPRLLPHPRDQLRRGQPPPVRGPLLCSAGADSSDGGGISVKYLSSSRLMGLQLRDATFRRHFLLQCLILMQARAHLGRGLEGGGQGGRE